MDSEKGPAKEGKTIDWKCIVIMWKELGSLGAIDVLLREYIHST